MRGEGAASLLAQSLDNKVSCRNSLVVVVTSPFRVGEVLGALPCTGPRFCLAAFPPFAPSFLGLGDLLLGSFLLALTTFLEH